MENLQLLLKNLTGKNEIEAEKAASYLIDNSDIKLFSMLIEKSNFLFGFVLNNVYKRIEKAVNKKNYLNIIDFFEIYSPFYDDLFANILAKNANEELTDKIFELLQKGNASQKTYAAKYFYYIPDTAALEDLSKYVFSDDEYLSFNSAQALGQMQDDITFDIALNLLESDDDFDKLKAVKFFSAYNRNFPLKEIFKALKSSKIPENIAGQIPYAISLLELIDSEYKEDVLITIDYIIAGLGEILSLSDIFTFEIFEILEELIYENTSENEYCGKIAQILLAAFVKFKEFNENQEYIYDEEKKTKDEIFDIFELLNAQNNSFWELQKSFVLKELEMSQDRILAAINVIKEYKIKDSIPKLKTLLNSDSEIIICEALNTLKILNAAENINIENICAKIQNPNIKAIIENMKC